MEQQVNELLSIYRLEEWHSNRCGGYTMIWKYDIVDNEIVLNPGY